jgi:hypothetical protein
MSTTAGSSATTALGSSTGSSYPVESWRHARSRHQRHDLRVDDGARQRIGAGRSSGTIRIGNPMIAGAATETVDPVRDDVGLPAASAS